MSYRSDLECMSSHMVVTKDSGDNLWFNLKCHNCERRVVCRKTLSEYAKIINEYEKIRESKGKDTIGDVLISTARSIGK